MIWQGGPNKPSHVVTNLQSPRERLRKGRRSGLNTHLFMQCFPNMQFVLTVSQALSRPYGPTMNEWSSLFPQGRCTLVWPLQRSRAVLQNWPSGGDCAGEREKKYATWPQPRRLCSLEQSPWSFIEGFSQASCHPLIYPQHCDFGWIHGSPISC